MGNLRLAQDESSTTEISYETKLIVAVIGMALTFCLLWVLIVSGLYQIVRISL
jgi:hypothetical protein